MIKLTLMKETVLSLIRKENYRNVVSPGRGHRLLARRGGDGGCGGIGFAPDFFAVVVASPSSDLTSESFPPPLPLDLGGGGGSGIPAASRVERNLSLIHI